MKDTWYNKLLLLVGVTGEGIGIAIIALTSLWDIFYMGVRGFMEYSIGLTGIFAIWIGLAFIVISKRIDRMTR